MEILFKKRYTVPKGREAAMPENVRRGYSPEDKTSFGPGAMETLRRAAADFCWLLDRGYPEESSADFIGNRFQLTARQRTALKRSVCSGVSEALRKSKLLPPDALKGKIAQIDGFNTIITMETALSGSPVLRGKDGAIRDLAGLKGNYRLIDKTDMAIRLILEKLRSCGAAGAEIFLESEVSNSGRLKARILELAAALDFSVNAETVGDADRELYGRSYIVTSDSNVINRCVGWVSLNAAILPKIPDAWIVDLFYPDAAEPGSSAQPGT